MSIDWNTELLLQLTWHWDTHLRPRLSGLTDEEYLWEPVAGCWSLRPRETATTPMAAGGGGGGGRRGAGLRPAGAAAGSGHHHRLAGRAPAGRSVRQPERLALRRAAGG